MHPYTLLIQEYPMLLCIRTKAQDSPSPLLFLFHLPAPLCKPRCRIKSSAPHTSTFFCPFAAPPRSFLLFFSGVSPFAFAHSVSSSLSPKVRQGCGEEQTALIAVVYLHSFIPFHSSIFFNSYKMTTIIFCCTLKL